MQRFNRAFVLNLNAHEIADIILIKSSKNCTDINIFHTNYEIYKFAVLKLPTEPN